MKINVDTFIDEMNNTGADQITIEVTFTKGQKNYTLKLCIEEVGAVEAVIDAYIDKYKGETNK